MSNTNYGNGTKNTGGANNSSFGAFALFSNTDASSNTAVGSNALLYNNGAYNSAFGAGAMCNNVTGTLNTALGSNALEGVKGSNSVGTANVAVGAQALFSNSSIQNTAVGIYSMMENTAGYASTAIGAASLEQNTQGYYNVAVGAAALRYAIGGVENVAVGYACLENTQSVENVAVGSACLENTQCGYNTAVGNAGLRYVDGTSNTAVGYHSLRGPAGQSVPNPRGGDGPATTITNVNFNTAIGFQAGKNIVAGSTGNTLLGSNTSITGAWSNSTAIGAGAQIQGDDEIRLGVTGTIVYADTIILTGPTGGTRSIGPDYTRMVVTKQEMTDYVAENGGSGGGGRGPTGPAGTDGAQGPKGDTGPAGTDGAQGPKGDTGPAGTDGAQGPKGDTGPTGTDGAQGPKGDTGPAGPAGANGSSSITGSQNITVSNGSVSLNTNLYNTTIRGLTLAGGSSNVSIGYTALHNNESISSTGQHNVAIGEYAIYENTTGSDNIAIGLNSLRRIKTGKNNIGVGSNTMDGCVYGEYNTAIGNSSLSTLSYDNDLNKVSYNTAIGNNSGTNANFGYYNTYIGAETKTLDSTLLYTHSTAIGAYAKITQSNQIQLGTSTETVNATRMTLDELITNDMASNRVVTKAYVDSKTAPSGGGTYTSGTNLTLSGTTFDLSSNITVTTINGLTLNYSTSGNTTIGSTLSNVTGGANIAIGSQALQSTTSGSNNTALGFYALKVNNTGSSNTAIGYQALSSNTTGADSNTAIGYQALSSNTTGDFNTAVGHNAGYNNNDNTLSQTGSYNLLLGYNTQYTNGITNSTAIGCNAKVATSNTIVLGTATEYVSIPGANADGLGLVITSKCSAASFNSTSDYRIKENVTNLDDTHTVDNLRPVTYTNTITNKPDMGLIAHELQAQYPMLVSGEKDGEQMQSVNYTGLIALLIKEIQVLKERVKTLELNKE
jgi:hypothetical protein